MDLDVGPPGVGKPKVRTKRCAFPKELCRACPCYAECVTDKRRRGRFVTLHPDERHLQAARALERTKYAHEQYRQRVIVEHRIARLVQLGIRQSRYFGRSKTLFQVLMAATVANLTLVANWQTSRGFLRRSSSALRRLLGQILVACRLLPQLGRSLIPVAA